MKIGDLVKMDFEGFDDWGEDDGWGIGVIVTLPAGKEIAEIFDDVEILWPTFGLGWEMVGLLEKVDESR